MADTIRTKAALIALLATNAKGEITAQTIRDMLVTVLASASVGLRSEVTANVPKDDSAAVWCAEVGAAYRYVSSATDTVDGWVVLSASVGRWILDGKAISLAPIGGTSDDWPRLVEALRACAPRGVEVHLRGGPTPWLCKSSPPDTGLYLPNGSFIVGNEGVRIVQSLTATGNALVAAFAATNTFDQPSTALSSNVVVGSRTFVVTGAPAFVVGDFIIADPTAVSTIKGAIYTVTAITGAGPYTVTVERPIRMPFVVGDTLRKTIPVQNITIAGNGMKMSGSGGRLIEFYGAVNCNVYGVYGDATQCTERAVSIDVASYNCHMWDCKWSNRKADGTLGVCQIGWSFESAEASTAHDVLTDSFLVVGHLLQDSLSCSISTSYDNNSVDGFMMLRSNGPQTSFDSQFIGCVATGCSGAGFVLDHGSVRSSCVGCVAHACATGFYQPSGAFTSAQNTYSACKSYKCTVYGFDVGGTSTGTLLQGCTSDGDVVGYRVDPGAKGTRFVACGVSAATSTGYSLADEAVIEAAPITDCAIGVIVTGVGSTSLIRIRDCEVTSTANGWAGIQVTGGTTGVVIVEGCKLTTTGSGSLAIQHLASSVVVLRDCYGSGGAGSYGYAGIAGATVRRHGRIDFTGFPNPFLIDASGYSNVGTVVANGVTGVDVNFPDLKAADVVTLTRVTDGGTPGPTPRVTKTPGTKFAINATAGDTSTYEYRIAS